MARVSQQSDKRHHQYHAEDKSGDASPDRSVPSTRKRTDSTSDQEQEKRRQTTHYDTS